MAFQVVSPIPSQTNPQSADFAAALNRFLKGKIGFSMIYFNNMGNNLLPVVKAKSFVNIDENLYVCGNEDLIQGWDNIAVNSDVYVYVKEGEEGYCDFLYSVVAPIYSGIRGGWYNNDLGRALIKGVKDTDNTMISKKSMTMDLALNTELTPIYGIGIDYLNIDLVDLATILRVEYGTLIDINNKLKYFENAVPIDLSNNLIGYVCFIDDEHCNLENQNITFDVNKYGLYSNGKRCSNKKYTTTVSDGGTITYSLSKKYDPFSNGTFTFADDKTIIWNGGIL